MKVGELLEHLRNVDPEMEIFVSPLIALPVSSMKPGVEPTIDRVASPFMRYEIGNVAMYRDMMIDGEPECVLIGFNDDIRKVAPTEEFVN